MATITKRGASWTVQVRRKGSAPQNRTFKKHSDAKAWAALMECKHDQGETLSPRKLLQGTTLGDVIDRYLREVTPTKGSAETERLRLGKMRRHAICRVPLAGLGSAHIAQYRDDRLRHIKPGTLQRELSILRNALNVARREWGLPLPQNPVELIRKPVVRNARDRRLLAGEEQRLLEAAAKARNLLFGPMIELAIQTALRRNELLNLRWRHIDLTARVAHIPHTKTDTPRTIPLTDAALLILGRLPRSSDRVFDVSVDAFKHGWRRILDRAGIVGLTFHDLRHEAISRFFELGLALPEVALISGHKDPRMLFRYTHLRPIELARKLAGRTWGGMAASCW